MEDKTCFFSIVSNNYFAQALFLFESIRKVYGYDVDCYLVVVDKSCKELNYSNKNFNVIFAENLGIENFNYYALKYNVIEFNTFVKPFAFLYFFNQYKKVIYLDPDIGVFSKLLKVDEGLEVKDVVLTPHKITLNSIPDDNDLNIRKGGFFNLGFIAARNTKNSIEIINYWANDLKENCYSEIANHKFTDQKSMSNLFYYFYNYIYVLNDPGYNYAPWNFCERDILKCGENIYCCLKGNEEKHDLAFFHFSGFKVTEEFDGEFFTLKHQDFNICKDSFLFSFLTNYRESMLKNHFLEYKKIPYFYNYFDNKKYISRYERKIYSFLVDKGIIDREENSFLVKNKFFVFLKKNNFLTNDAMVTTDLANLNALKKGKFSGKEKILKKLMKFIKVIIGTNNYVLLMKYMTAASAMSYQMYMVEDIIDEKKN